MMINALRLLSHQPFVSSTLLPTFSFPLVSWHYSTVQIATVIWFPLSACRVEWRLRTPIFGIFVVPE